MKLTDIPVWCSCNDWLIGTAHSCEDCEEDRWLHHVNCVHNESTFSPPPTGKEAPE